MAKRGRPRTFDRAVALRRAMEVFWRRGYQGASMAELTTAMGIGSPSPLRGLRQQGSPVPGSGLAAIGGIPDSDQVSRFLAQCRQRDIDEVRRRIDRGISEGDLPATADRDALARFVGAVVQGMSVQARDGATATDLNGIVDCAMAAWDGLVGTGASDPAATTAAGR